MHGVVDISMDDAARGRARTNYKAETSRGRKNVMNAEMDDV